jgi:hypothetical protein
MTRLQASQGSKVSGSILPVAEFTLLLIETIRRRAARSALLRVDVAAHHSLCNRRDNKIIREFTVDEANDLQE